MKPNNLNKGLSSFDHPSLKILKFNNNQGFFYYNFFSISLTISKCSRIHRMKSIVIVAIADNCSSL